MKAVFISYNQALTDRVMYILDRQRIRGFTKWETVHGRGSVDGEPHYGNHTWPAMNTAILAVIEDEKVAPLMDTLRKLDESASGQGLRFFVWNIEQQM
ncbi:MAG: hypothetical protein LBH34_03970 [Prevotellaceae bacterium]|jgi:nitrogen regulatory protein PII|nr:hypothetical protein [Prevotellaceae bacterium]